MVSIWYSLGYLKHGLGEAKRLVFIELRSGYGKFMVIEMVFLLVSQYIQSKFRTTSHKSNDFDYSSVLNVLESSNVSKDQSFIVRIVRKIYKLYRSV